MPVEVESIPLRFLENMPAYDNQRCLFDIWQANNGYDSPDMLEMANELILLSTPYTHELPEMLSLGRNSLAAKVLGADWRDEAIKRGEAEALGSGYNALIEGQEPIYEWVRYKASVAGRETELIYTRALFLFKTKAGLPYVATMAKCVDFSQKFAPLISQDLQMNPLKSPGTSNPPLLGSDGTPIVTHLESDP
ncbi:MAG: hypothetical protein AAGF54_04895 [Pseudomonadota bacterium]